MALSKAIDFVNRVGEDMELRKLCNKSSSREELLRLTGFDDDEFDNAINMRLVKCQSYEEAAQFQEMRLWFSLL